jgi:arylsulfatase A-like enzyme
MVQSLDENVGRLLTELKQQNILDQTVVILTSDNGGFINKFRGNTVTNNAPLRSGKGSLYEGGIRVPLLIRWPHVTTPNSVSHEPVTTCDFYPTLQAALNLPSNTEHNSRVDGTNLFTLLKNPTTSLNRGPLFWHYPHYYQTTDPVSSIRDGDWKLLKYHHSDRVELFNLAEDISEANNLATKQPQTTATLLSKLATWQTKVNAQMPTLNTQFKQER